MTQTKKNKGKIQARPDWDEYFLEIAKLVSSRSTCLRRKVGALIVREKRILATGYNGAPRTLKHCSETGCLRLTLNVPAGERHELCRGLHAEQNALLQASLHGVSVKDSVLYCTNQPCLICAKMLINAGISEVVISEGYPDKMSMDFFSQAGIRVRTYKK
ncbi:MAG: cytidine/deoxycytidylate deaminase family protein [Candidatus Omnitrophica bacterium]|nr:cytidine/deoxycytidylate deaminase family protein [Candidatus Omnitrophota bacterium]